MHVFKVLVGPEGETVLLIVLSFFPLVILGSIFIYYFMHFLAKMKKKAALLLAFLGFLIFIVAIVNPTGIPLDVVSRYVCGIAGFVLFSFSLLFGGKRAHG